MRSGDRPDRAFLADRHHDPAVFPRLPPGTADANAVRMSLTREDLHLGLHRFATKHDLERFATKQELAALREDSARGFDLTRRHIDKVADDLAARIERMLNGFDRNGRGDASGSARSAISPLPEQPE